MPILSRGQRMLMRISRMIAALRGDRRRRRR